jgi:hypothetical protein
VTEIGIEIGAVRRSAAVNVAVVVVLVERRGQVGGMAARSVNKVVAAAVVVVVMVLVDMRATRRLLLVMVVVVLEVTARGAAIALDLQRLALHVMHVHVIRLGTCGVGVPARVRLRVPRAARVTCGAVIVIVMEKPGVCA